MAESITRQEKIIAEVQDLYQPFIQERGSGGAREEALKSIASVGLKKDIIHQLDSFNIGSRRFYGIERESSRRNKILQRFDTTFSDFPGNR